jgi:hypothetical protein
MMKVSATHVTDPGSIGGFPPPGKYRVLVAAVDEFQKNAKALNVEFKIRLGTIPGQSGKSTHQMLWLTKEGEVSDSILKFALLTGLIQPGTEADVDFRHAIGRELVIELEETVSSKDGKKYINIAEWSMAMWPVDHPDVPSVLKAEPPAPVPTPAAPPAQNSRPATAPAQTAAAAAPGGWDDI